MIYDLIIVGAGIGGLYTAHNYMKKYPTHNILILERNRKIGGRIDTYYDRNYPSGIEAGAGRFHKKQRFFNKLLKELDLENKSVPITNFEIYYPIETKKGEPIDTKSIQKIIEKSKNIPDNVLKNTIFLDFAKTVLQNNEIKKLVGSFGYSSELTDMNAYDTIVLIEKHFDPKIQYYSLRGGLYQVVEKIHKKLKNTTILIHRRVVETKYDVNTQIFTVSCENIQKKYYSKKCVYATTKETLIKQEIFQPLFPILEKIKTLPLCRIYAKFSPSNNEWFRELPKITTNNNIRIIIPINETTIMISYSDNKYARFWKTLEEKEGIPGINRELRRLIKQTLNKEIPEPEHTKIFYWEHAVAYFDKGFDSNIDTKKIMYPYKKIPLFVCGENFSEKNSQWIEGALDTSDYIQKYL